MALASVRVAASVTLGTTKARWMTPSLSRAPARRTPVSFRSPRSTSAPRPATALAAASERASPRTWWPALMSSGTTAEPIQPEAPVTKMRMEVSLVVVAVTKVRGAGAAAGRPDAIQSHQLRDEYATKSHHLTMMRPGRVA